MDRTIVLLNLVLSGMFLAAGMTVLFVSNFTAGVGLLSAALALSYGTVSTR